MRHADLLLEATAVIATPASAPCMILRCGTWYGCVAVWPCGCVFGGGINDAIGSKNTCKTFWTKFFEWRVQSKNSSFSTGSASRNSQSKKVESKKPFFDCVRKLDLGFSRKRSFSTDKSDCVRNGLRPTIRDMKLEGVLFLGSSTQNRYRDLRFRESPDIKLTIAFLPTSTWDIKLKCADNQCAAFKEDGKLLGNSERVTSALL